MSIIIENMEQALEQYNKQNFTSALNFATLAIEATAEKYYKKPAGRELYKKFLRNYYWILEPFMGLPKGSLNNHYPLVEIYDERGKLIGGAEGPDVADIIYHMFRCEIHHGKPIPIRFSLMCSAFDGGIYLQGAQKENASLMLPQNLIIGLLGICLFCKDNTDLKANVDDEDLSFLYYDSSIIINNKIVYENFDSIIIKMLILRGEDFVFSFCDNFGEEDKIRDFLAKQPRQPKLNPIAYYNMSGALKYRYEKEYLEL